MFSFSGNYVSSLKNMHEKKIFFKNMHDQTFNLREYRKATRKLCNTIPHIPDILRKN